DCTFSDNHATGGGAIANLANGTVYLTDCTFIGNGAVFGGAIYNDHGMLTLTNCVINDNFGGILCQAGSINTIINCVVSGNQPDSVSPGIYSYGNLSILNSTIAGNSGGGISISSPGMLTLASSTVNDNSSGSGGGIYFGGAPGSTITGCTISGNSAASSGGGI